MAECHVVLLQLLVAWGLARGSLYFWGVGGNTALPTILPGQTAHGMMGQMHLESVGIAASVTLCRSDTCKNGGWWGKSVYHACKISVFIQQRKEWQFRTSHLLKAIIFWWNNCFSYFLTYIENINWTPQNSLSLNLKICLLKYSVCFLFKLLSLGFLICTQAGCFSNV